MLNSEFAVWTSEAFARRLLSETDGTDEALVQRAWQIAASRAPGATETTLALEFLVGQRAQYEGDDAAVLALADFCQMLLASNAFLYVE